MSEISNEEYVKSIIDKTDRDRLQSDKDWILWLQQQANLNRKLRDEEIKQMFSIRNYYMPIAEYGYWCSRCRQTCYETLCKILILIIQKLDI
jgi:hypothetical protein